MSITINDPVLLNQLQSVGEPVTLLAPDGQPVGHFQNLFRLPPGFKIPFTEEELVEMQKQKTGRPLEDVLADLESGKLP